MTDKKLIKSIEKHINNGHSVEKMCAWWLRLMADTAEQKDGQVTFYLTTVDRKRRVVYSRPVW